jgi:magnesium transporter
MITCRFYRDGTLEREEAFVPGTLAAASETGRRVWLDAVDPTDPELDALGAELGLHELALEDSRRWGQRAKIERYPDHLFLVAHALELDRRAELVDREIHLFVAGSFVATVRREPTLDLGSVAARLTASPLAAEGVGFMVYLLLDQIVDGYLDAVGRLEDLGDDMEEAVAGEEAEGPVGERSRALAARIFRLRTQVVRFRRLAAPMREVVDAVLEDPELGTPALAPYFRDVLDHVIRTTELLDNVRDLLTSARELQLAQASNRLNAVMKQLSAWAAIILIPTLIAGIYGMNFERMPELGWALGYPFALALMAGAAFLLYRVFRRRGWL